MVITDNFSKFGWTVPLKNKNAQTITDEFSKTIIKSKRKPNLIETDRGKEFYNNLFIDFSKINDIKRYSGFTDTGAVFAKRFNRTFRKLLKKPVFEKGNANWIDEIKSFTKQYNNTNHHCIKMTPKKSIIKN